MPIDISIVIPVHNEEESLKELIPALTKELKNSDKSYEIIMVNDVSADNSETVIKDFQKNHPEIKLINLTQRGGQTGCYKEAFKQAMGDYIIRMDADYQDDPKDLPLFFQKIDEGAELIMGVRECRKHSKLLRIASGIYDLIIVALFNSPLHTNSGSFIGFKANYVKNIPFRKNDHRYLTLIAMQRGTKNISEVFVRHRERKHGKSKYNPYIKLLLGIPEVFRFLIRLKRNVYNVDQGMKNE